MVNKKVLIIDDNIIFCNALKYHLLQMEYIVETCISYADFKKRIDLVEFDYIVLDLKLKDAEGIEILELILKTDPYKVVIIVSSFLDDKSISRAMDIGAYKCIPKRSDMFKELDRLMKNAHTYRNKI